MGFKSGSISCRRFAVLGQSNLTGEEILAKLSEHAFRANVDSVPDEVQYGWCGARHVMDSELSFDNNVFNDVYHFAMRVETNKVPGTIKQAYTAMEEAAVAKGNPSGFISKAQKHEVRGTVRQKLEEELKEGKHRRSKIVPVLWDYEKHTIYSTAAGADLERLSEIFERTFGLELLPLTAGAAALRILEVGKRSTYEDLRPTRFVLGPDGEAQHPEYPWVTRGLDPKAFVGNEFLMWLWMKADTSAGAIGDITVFLDRSLDLECAYGQTGKDSLRGDAPNRMAETKYAVGSGKVARKVGLVVECDRQQFALTLNGETLSIGSASLPDVEDAETPRQLFEERIKLLANLYTAIDRLFADFLRDRISSAWPQMFQRWTDRSQSAEA
jgi:hypothetical protein